MAAIATVLHRPFTLRQNFINLARATFSDKTKLKDSQDSNESVFQWLPFTKRLVKHFTDTALLPAVLSHFQPEEVDYLTSPVLEKVREDLSFLAAEALFDGRSLREIRDFTKRWHALSDKHPIPISYYASWNSILPNHLSLPNGFVVKDIHTVESLRDIGGKMNNCLVDGVHASQCYLGRARILAIFKDDIPIVAMTLEILDERWCLTEYEGPGYSEPDEGPESPLTHFKERLAANHIKFDPAIQRSIYPPAEYENTGDGFIPKFFNYFDTYRTHLAADGNDWLRLALQAPGIDATAFYRRWVVLSDKGTQKPVPLLRDEAIMKCNESIKEITEAVSLYLEYSKKLYKSYPDWAVKKL